MSAQISERNINHTHDEVTKLPSIMMDKNASYEGSVTNDNLLVEEHDDDHLGDVTFDQTKNRSLVKELTVEDDLVHRGVNKIK